MFLTIKDTTENKSYILNNSMKTQGGNIGDTVIG